MFKYCLVIFGCLIFFLGACKKDNNIPQPGLYTPVAPLSVKGAGVATPVTGNWQWIRSFHTSTGTLTPGITNYSERVVFGTDSVMTIYRNDTYYYQFTYLYQGEYKYKGATFPVTLINGYTYQTTLKNDTLSFSTFDQPDKDQMIYVKIN